MKYENIINLKKNFVNIVTADVSPDCLYHYTSIENFKNILESKEFWMTSAHCFFNDPSEITIAKKITLKVLEERKSDFVKRGLYDICIKDTDEWVEKKGNIFVCSLTEKEDLLSQWRAYCPKGGVAIGLSVPKINERDQYVYSAENYYVHSNYLYKCIYSEEKQRQKIHEMFDLFLDPKFQSIPLDILKSPLWNAIRYFSFSFKHKSFEEEQEWRLCIPYNATEYEMRPKYRVKDSVLVPYLPIKILDGSNHTIIKSIKIGPSQNKEVLKSTITSYLMSLGYKPGKEIAVSVTDTPYQYKN